MKHPQKKKQIPKKTEKTKEIIKEKEYINPKTFRSFSFFIIIILGIIVYSNTFENSFHFDDGGNISENTFIRDFHHLKDLWHFGHGRIIGFITFAINYHFGQYKVWGYHLFNLIIHLINALLIWWLVRITIGRTFLSKETIHKHKDIISLLAALVFVSHPIETQAVTYIVQRLASLASLFYLLSVCCYARARTCEDKPRLKWVFFPASFLSALAAMFTKEITFTLPFAILLYELFFLSVQGKWKTFLKNPFTIAGIIIFASLLIIIPSLFPLTIFNKITPQQGHTYTLTVGTYLLTQFRVITTYIRLLFIPVNQVLEYDFRISESFFEFSTLAAFVFLIFIVIGVIWLFKKYRLVSFGIFWFFLTLLVESSIIPIVNVIFEHRVYLPSVGFAIAFTAGLYYLLNPKRYSLFLLIMIIFIGINSILTFQRNKVWKSDYTLWSDNVDKVPGKSRPWNNLGKALRARGDYDGAINAYNHSIELNPNYELPYYNRGNIWYRMQNYKRAIEDYSMALKINPRLSDGYNNRGSAELSMGDAKSAIADFTKVLQLSPEFIMALNNRGVAENSAEQYAKAIEDFTVAIKKMPDVKDAYYNRGNAKINLGRNADAILDFDKAIEVNSMDLKSFIARGIAKFNLTKFQDAIKDYTDALAIDPGYADAYLNRGNAKYESKDYQGALMDFDAAIKINDATSLAYKNRGLAKLQLRDQKGACDDWRKALQLKDMSALNYIFKFCR